MTRTLAVLHHPALGLIEGNMVARLLYNQYQTFSFLPTPTGCGIAPQNGIATPRKLTSGVLAGFVQCVVYFGLFLKILIFNVASPSKEAHNLLRNSFFTEKRSFSSRHYLNFHLIIG